MRAYKVSTNVQAEDDDGYIKVTQFAGTQATAKATRRDFMADHGVKMAEVSIEEVDVPTSKGPLIDFVNELLS